MRWAGLSVAMLALGTMPTGGCVERTLTIRSDPPGALVTLNDMEIGRTPLKKQFVWYGTFDAQVRLEGYRTIDTSTPVIAPWWQWLPFDLVAELLPVRLHDDHVVSYTLTPLSREQVDPEAIVRRGERLGEQLESSRLPPSATRPTTRPSRKTKRSNP